MKRHYSLLLLLFVVIFFVLLPSPRLFAQENEVEKNYFQAFFQGFASNFLVWGFDYAVLQAGYAQISPATWRANLREGFQWDNSEFHTNQILHPYQGNTYFNAARLYGFNFWESIPFVLTGSLIWEFFGERENASLNDFITTSLGGLAMGEVGYRLSAALIDPSSTGANRFARESLAALLNPVLLFNRLIYGEEFLARLPKSHPPLNLSLHLGVNATKDFHHSPQTYPHPFLGLDLQYGDPLGSGGDVRAPYDYFQLQIGLYGDIGNPGSDVFAHGILYGRRLYLDGEGRALVGLFQHFDYLDNFKYKLASNAVGPGLEMAQTFQQGRELGLMIHLFAVPLGLLDSRYSRGITGRDYIMGPGAGFKTGLRWSFSPGLSLGLRYYYYTFYTVSGSDSRNGAGLLAFPLEGSVRDDRKLGLEFRLYHRRSDVGFDDALSLGLRAYLAFIL